MRPLSIRLKNFHSHKESYINFRNRKQSLILGEIDGRKDVSNGAGKSALLDAMRFVLFGNTRSGNEKAIRDYQKECAVVFVFRGNDGNKYRVRRSLHLSSKGKVSSELDFHFRRDGGWARKEGDLKKSKGSIEAEIHAVIGMDVHVFNHSVYIAQNNVGAFADAKPTERKNFLKRIIDLKKWDELEAIAKRNLGDKKKAYEAEKKLIEELETRVEDPHLLVLDIDKHKIVLDSKIKDRLRAEDSRIALVDRLKNTEAVESLSQRIAQLLREREAAQKSIERCSDGIKNLKTDFEREVSAYKPSLDQEPFLKQRQEEVAQELVVIDRTETLYQVVQKEKLDLSKQMEKLQTEIQDVRATLKNIKQQIDDVDALNDHCPTCLSEIDERKRTDLRERLKKLFASTQGLIARPKEDLTKISLSLEEKSTEEHKLFLAVQRRAVVRAEKVQIENQFKGIQEAQRYLAQKRESVKKMMVQYKNDREELEKKVPVLDSEMETLKIEHARAQEDVHDLQQLKNEYAQTLKLLSSLDGEVVSYQGIIGGLTRRHEMAVTLLRDLEEKKLNQGSILRQINNLNTVATYLGKKGIQAIIIENSLADLEAFAKLYLKRFTDDRFDITFRTTVESKSTENIQETLDIMIDKGNGVWHPYESFSGGEKMRIAFALRIAISMLVSHYSNVRPEYLYIDEVDGSLDLYYRKVFVDMLAELSKDFDLILLVTHRAGLQEEFRDTITVKKLGDDSFIDQDAEVDPEDADGEPLEGTSANLCEMEMEMEVE